MLGFFTLRCWQFDGFILGGGGTNLRGIGTFVLLGPQILGGQIGIIFGGLEQTGFTLPEIHSHEHIECAIVV